MINFVYLPIIDLKGVFLKCGDYKMGIARVKCTNSNCNHDFFVPLSIIMEPAEVNKVLRHLVKIGRAPPNFDINSLN